MTGRVMGALVMVLVMTSILSVTPAVAARIWARWGGYPDLVVARETVAESILPWRGSAAALVDRAWERATRAAAEPEVNARNRGFLAARRDAVLAYLVLHGPVFLLWGAAIGGLILWSRGAGPQEVDLEVGVLSFDLQGVSRVGLRVAERQLPTLGDVEPARTSLGLDDEQVEVFEDLRRMAIDAGPGASDLQRELERLPAGLSERFRAALAERSPAVRLLSAYRAAWQDRGGKGRASLKELPRGLRRLLREGVPPSLVELREELREMGELTPLVERGLAILAAHPEHPASVGFHGSEPGGLIEHTVAVVRKGLAMMLAGDVAESEREVLAAALVFHDIGKVVSFRVEEGEFVRRDGLHAQNGALILGVLPELWSEHGEEKDGGPSDATRLLMSVAHAHDPDEIPMSLRASCEPLLEVMTEADGSVTQLEGPVSRDLLEEALDAVEELFPSVLKDMNINGGKLISMPDGFFDPKEQLLLVRENRFRDELTACLDPLWRRGLQMSFRRRAGRAHPGWLAVAKRLASRSALPRSVKLKERTVPVDENFLLSALVGKVIYRGLFPVDLGWLRSKVGSGIYEQLTFQWELVQTFPILAVETGTDVAGWKALHQALEESRQPQKPQKPESQEKPSRKRRSRRRKRAGSETAG